MAYAKKTISWPWAIGIIYGLFVIILIGYVIFSNLNHVDLVYEDYYARDLRYQKQIDRVERTKKLTAGLTWEYTAQKKIISLQFPREIDTQQITGQIVFFRPSDARLDKTIPVNPTISNSQLVNISNLAPGMWRLKIFWRIGDRDYYDEGMFIVEASE